MVEEIVRDLAATGLNELRFSVKLDDPPNMPVAICFAIAEQRAGEPVLRELMLQRTTPATFDYDTDL